MRWGTVQSTTRALGGALEGNRGCGRSGHGHLRALGTTVTGTGEARSAAPWRAGKALQLPVVGRCWKASAGHGVGHHEALGGARSTKRGVMLGGLL